VTLCGCAWCCVQEEEEEEDERLAITGAAAAHRERCRGLVLGEAEEASVARALLSHPAPPVEALKARLRVSE